MSKAGARDKGVYKGSGELLYTVPMKVKMLQYNSQIYNIPEL